MCIEILSDGPVSPNLAAGDGDSCCAYPLTTPLGDGKVATVYRRGATKHSHDGVLVTQTSRDNGVSWGEPRVVFDGTHGRPPRTATSGAVVRTPRGDLLAVFGVVEGLQPGVYMFDTEGDRLPRRIITCRSEDDGRTWSPPEVLATPGIGRAAVCARPFVAAAAELCVLLEIRASSGVQATAAMLSGDDGRSFGEPIVVAEDPAGRLSLCDARPTVLPDGRVLVMLWTFRKDGERTIEVHRTFSDDGGHTWTEPRGIGLVGQITAPLALPSGAVLAATNVRQPPEGIQLWCSPDGGESWDAEQRVRMWDSGKSQVIGERVSPASAAEPAAGIWDELQRFSFGTPDLVLLADDSVLMTYYATVNDVIHVRACRFRVGTPL